MALSDANSHPPASSGDWAYNATPNYPATRSLGVAGEVVDPVFGETIRRMTNIGANAAQNNNYAFHSINADNTLMFFWNGSGLQIISTETGSTVHANQPDGDIGYEARWSMTDPDKYFYRSGANLIRRNLAAQTNTTIKTFDAALQDMGGTANYQDKTDRYFLVRYNIGGTIRTTVWDSVEDVVYSGGVAGLGNWSGIAPSGRLFMSSNDGQHLSYYLDHGANSIGSAINCYGFGGDHGGIVSTSDGEDYFVMQQNDTDPASVMAFDCSVANTGTQAQQIANGIVLVEYGDTTADYDNGFHCSPVSLGEFQDWIFVSTEEEDGDGEFDGFNDPDFLTNWRPWRQELYAVNVLTQELRRLCHHRSRGAPIAYFCQPKPSCSPDGATLMFSSNMNNSTPTEYADQYLIPNPLGISGGGEIAAALRPSMTM